MKKLLIGIIGLLFLINGSFQMVLADAKSDTLPPAAGSNNSKENDCIKLNTDVPFVADESRCIPKTESGKIFPILMGGMSKFIVNAILIVSFIMLVAGGMLMTVSGFSSGAYNKGKDLIMKVVIGIILLGTSSLILYIINPNFFRN